MDNPARTAAYQDEMAQRRVTLETELNPILADVRPLVWEVGAGHGHFLADYAAAHREKLCIGIDIASDRVGRALRKSARARLGNLHFIRAEARLFLEVLPLKARLREIFILFPDPWPKSRHHKHRILQPGFLSAAAAHAAEDCRLYFRTDHRPYFEDVQGVLREHPDWTAVDEPWPHEFSTVFQSRAAAFQSLIGRRVSHPGPSLVSEPEKPTPLISTIRDPMKDIRG